MNLLIIPHYNNHCGLLKSIESIGPKEKLDVLIIDDGSLLKLDEDELNHSIKFKGTLSVHYFKENKGIEYALNYGLEYAISEGYQFVSRLDCGDLCAPNRFEQQQAYLQANEGIAIIGSNVRFFYNDKTVFVKKFPQYNNDIQVHKFFNSPFSHPAVMMRTSILEDVGKYSYKFKRAEDYELFFRILNSAKGHNIQEVLVHAELNPNGISLSNRKEQIRTRIRVQKLNFRFLNLYSYIGVVVSFILFVAPYRLIEFLKSKFF